MSVAVQPREDGHRLRNARAHKVCFLSMQPAYVRYVPYIRRARVLFVGGDVQYALRVTRQALLVGGRDGTNTFVVYVARWDGS